MQVYNDEICHYGVPGMKWGRRIGSKIKPFVKMQKNSSIHPIHSTKAQISMIRKNPRTALYINPKDADKFNADVKKRVESSKKKATKKHIAKGAKVAGKTLSLVSKNAVRLYQWNNINKAMETGLNLMMK